MPDLEIATPEWAEPLLVPARYKGAWGGRGSGKSHFFAELMIEEHVANPNQLSVCIREYQRTLDQSVKRLLEGKIDKLGVRSHFDVQDRQIKNRRGNGVIIFEGMQNYNAESIKSLEGFDRAWFAEAQRASQRSLDILRPTIRKDADSERGITGSELWFDWNPNESTDPIDKLLRGDNPPPDAVVVGVNYMHNPWFPEVLRREMEYCRKTDPDKYRHIWLGEYNERSEKRVYRNWREEEFDTPADAMLYLGADWGFSQDPAVMVRCFIIGRTLYIDYEAYQLGCELDDLPALFMTIPDSERWPSWADPARPDTISHMRRHGFPKMLSAVAGKIEDGVEFLRSFEIVVHPRCVHVLDELSAYSYKVDALTGAVLPVIEDKNNHCMDALRYATSAARRGIAGNRQAVVSLLVPSVSAW